MALKVATTLQGLSIPEAYARIGGLYFNGGIGPKESFAIEFRLDTYANEATYLEGVLGALKSDSIEVAFPAVIDESLDAQVEQLCNEYEPEQLKILTFALIRKLGYLAAKQRPEFENAIDV